MTPWSPPLNDAVRPAGSAAWAARPNGPVGQGASTGGEFGKVLNKIQTEDRPVTVQKGDTLVGIVTQQYKQQGQTIDGRRAYREALRLAKENGIPNADVILPGDQIRLAANRSDAPSMSTLDALKQKAQQVVSATGAAGTSTEPSGPNSLLDQTLLRAVEKGFVSATDAVGAKAKVHALSEKFGFDPDHFAMLTLMESGGMNPQASNGRCHGIIQFCEGPGRGAASVGMAGQAKRILGMGLLSQLDLVEKYFQDIGMEQSGKKMGLDDLYLSVLTPAARQETRRQVPLPIPGRQALDLYASGSVSQGITRDSIVAGLTNLARKMFPNWQPGLSTPTQVAQTPPPRHP